MLALPRRGRLVALLLFIFLLHLVRTCAQGRYGRIALLVAGDATFLRDKAVAVASKRCYCARHGYHFLLVENPPTHGRKPHWGRISALVDALPRYDWVLYQDADTFVTNADVTVESMIDVALAAHETMKRKWWPLAEGSSGPFVVVQDSMEVNSGGVLIRGGGGQRETAAFLDAWWQLKDATAHFGLNDQPALQAALLSYAVRYTGFRRKHGVDPLSLCLSRQNYWQWVSCWNMWMSWMGLPLGERSIGGVVFLRGQYYFAGGDSGDGAVTATDPLSGLFHAVRHLPAFLRTLAPSHSSPPPHYAPRGFNLLNPTSNSDIAFHHHPSQLWRVGDFVAHITSGPLFQRLFQLFNGAYSPNITHNCSLWTWPLIAPACVQPPCQPDLWHESDVGYRYPNRWSQYVHSSPITMVPVSSFAYDSAVGVTLPTKPLAVCESLTAGTSREHDAEAATSLGMYDAPDIAASFEEYFKPYAFQRDAWMASWWGHLHVTLVFNVSSFAGNLPDGTHALLAADVHISPHEDFASRLVDFIEFHANYAFVEPVLRAVASHPQIVACRPGMTTKPRKPRMYINSTEHLMRHALITEHMSGPNVLFVQ